MSVCSLCSKKTKANTCVTCDICRKTVHSECAGLSTLEADCIRSSTRKIHFYCDNCDIISIVNSLKAEINVLKSELTELKNQQINNATNLGADKKLSDEEIFSEIEERSRRANNLILLNLPESKEEPAAERKADDFARCVNTILSNASTSAVSCARLGKFDKDRIRPLRIVFSTHQQAVDTLRAYRFKGNLYLNRDLTPRQQNYSYLIRSEFKKRKEQGETDIILKYRNGIPTIIKNQTKNA